MPKTRAGRPSHAVLHVAIAVLRRPADGRVLIARRLLGKTYADCWEFPGGKIEQGETAAAAVVREAAEELGVRVEIVRPLPAFEHEDGGRRYAISPFACRVVEGEPRAVESREIRWVRVGELSDYPFPPANETFLAGLPGILGEPDAGR